MKLAHKFNRLRIRGKWWRFDWDYKGKTFGMCVFEERKIQINLRKHKTTEPLVNTLAHEIAHATKFDLPHKDVYALASAWTRCLLEGGIICG